MQRRKAFTWQAEEAVGASGTTRTHVAAFAVQPRAYRTVATLAAAGTAATVLRWSLHGFQIQPERVRILLLQSVRVTYMHATVNPNLHTLRRQS